jgi:hypothetical protein
MSDAEVDKRRQQREQWHAQRLGLGAVKEEVIHDAIPPPAAAVAKPSADPAPAPAPAPANPAKPWLFQKGDDPRRSMRGRTRGSKDRIGEPFVKALLKWFNKSGMKAIEKVGKEKPEELLRIIAGFVPKQVDVDHEHHGSVTFRPVDLRLIEQRTQELLSGVRDRVVAGYGEARPVLDAVVHAGEEGRGEAVDSGAVPGSPGSAE